MGEEGVSRRTVLRAGIALGAVALGGMKDVVPSLDSEDDREWEARRDVIGKEFESAVRKPRFLPEE